MTLQKENKYNKQNTSISTKEIEQLEQKNREFL